MSSLIENLLSGSASQQLGAFFGIFVVVVVVILLVAIMMVASLWKIFTKANQPGWAALIPFYNQYTLVSVARLPIYYFIVLIIPTLLSITKVKIPDTALTIVGLIAFGVYFFVIYNLCKQFGKGIGYTLGMIFLPFIFY